MLDFLVKLNDARQWLFEPREKDLNLLNILQGFVGLCSEDNLLITVLGAMAFPETLAAHLVLLGQRRLGGGALCFVLLHAILKIL